MPGLPIRETFTKQGIKLLGNEPTLNLPPPSQEVTTGPKRAVEFESQRAKVCCMLTLRHVNIFELQVQEILISYLKPIGYSIYP